MTVTSAGLPRRRRASCPVLDELRRESRTRRTRAWAAVAAATGLGLGQVPLFGVLGYELAVAMAVLGAVLGLDVGAAVSRRQARAARATAPSADAGAPGQTGFAAPPRPRGAGIASGAVAAVCLSAGLILIPAVLCAIRGAWTPTCDWGFGLLAYATLPVTTAVLAAATGYGVGALTGPAPYLGALAAQLPLVAGLGLGVARFYGAPPVFSYSPIVGYFPGNLYDEHVVLGAPLAWARLEQLAGVVAWLGVVALGLEPVRRRWSWRWRLRPAAAGCAALGAALAAGLRLRAGSLGYAIDADDVAAALGGTRETAHFIIHYARTPEVEAELDLVAADHEFRYAQVVATLGAAPPGKLTSFYFADREQKARWIGARDVEMAKPWRREIYLDARPFPHPSLRHEIAHAVASAFGDPLFGVAARRVLGLPLLANPGLIEGLAVAADWPGGADRLTPHEAVRAMQALGVTPALGDVLSLRFLSVSSARSYTTAGSFLRLLLEERGAAALRTLYRTGGDFAAAYGEPQDVLEARWRARIAAIELPPEVVESVRERFRGGSVFARPCPHAVAARRDRALAALGRGDRPAAIAALREVCADVPEEPRHRLELGDFLAGASATAAELAEAEALWRRLAEDADGVTAAIRGEAFERLARLAARRGDDAGLRAAVAAVGRLPLEPAARRNALAEDLALRHPGPAAPALRDYFFAPPGAPDPLTAADLAAQAEPGLGFARYLRGLQRALAGAWADAADDLGAALDLGLPGPPFVRNAARRLAVAAYRAKRPDLVERAAAVLADAAQPEVDRLLAADWRARLAFDAAGGTTPTSR